MSTLLYNVPLVAPRVSITGNNYVNIYAYGYDNVYPQQMKEYMFASGVTQSAVNKFKDFIFGDSFVNKALEEIVIDRKGNTVFDLLEQAAKQKAWIDTICFHVNYNALLQVVEVRPVPVEFARLGDPETEHAGKVAIWNDWAGESPNKNQTTNDIEWLDLYSSDPEIIQMQIEEAGGFLNWKGQILYVNQEQSFTYSKTTFDSVRDDVITDAAFAMYRKKNVKSSFSASGIIKYNSLVESETERNDIVEQIQNSQGDEEAGNVMIVFPTEGEGDAEAPISFTPIQQNNIDNLYVNQEKSVISRIVGNYNQPRALHTYFEDSGIYNTDLLKTAWAYYNEQTKKQRREVSKVFKMLFDNWHNTDLQNKDFTIKPQAFDLGIETITETKTPITTEGKPLEVEPIGDGTEAQESLRGSVGGVTGILALVEQYNTGGLTESAAIAMLIELFGFDDPTARKILGV